MQSYRSFTIIMHYESISVGSGKGGRAIWGLGLRRDAQSPRQALCFLRSICREVSPCSSAHISLFFYFPISSYILFILDITYLYLINNLCCARNFLINKVFYKYQDFHSRSYEIVKGSFEMHLLPLFMEFYNEKRVLQLK